MNYPDRLEALRKIQKHPGTVLTKQPKGPFVGSVGTEPGPCTKNLEPVALVPQAAVRAGLRPDTLAALLSDEDYKDLLGGILGADELTAYARSVAARWANGCVLQDETALATAERPHWGAPMEI